MAEAHRPPLVDSTVEPRPVDFWRVAWWQIKAPFQMGFGKRHQLADDRRIAYIYVGILLIFFAIVLIEAHTITQGWGTAVIIGAIATGFLSLITYLVTVARESRQWCVDRRQPRCANDRQFIRGDPAPSTREASPQRRRRRG